MQKKNSRIHSIEHHKSYNIQLFPKKNGISSILKQRKKLDKDIERNKNEEKLTMYLEVEVSSLVLKLHISTGSDNRQPHLSSQFASSKASREYCLISKNLLITCYNTKYDHQNQKSMESNKVMSNAPMYYSISEFDLQGKLESNT